jgi:hypothetical protein
MNLHRISIRKLTTSLLSILFLVQLLGGSFYSLAQAQSGEEEWSSPVNLSNSGSASEPSLLIDSDGIFHVIWKDRFAGYVHTNGDGSQWSGPVPVRFPFDSFNPILVATPNGFVHAFWIDEENQLFTSRVSSEDFADSGSWTPAQQLSDSAMDVDAVVDQLGNIHLVFARPLEAENQPAGVYYLQLRPEILSWPDPVLLYQSPYFRSLTDESANVKVATAGTNGTARVYVVWDNPSRERVFEVQSLDTGASWNDPVEIAAPVDGVQGTGPSGITVGVQGQDVLLIWQTGAAGPSCSQYYQWSFDGGLSWQTSERMLVDIPGCPESNQILRADNYVYLLTSVLDQVYLLAWDGKQWSNPQPQAQLSNFTDPETLKPVNFSCRQPVIFQERLYVVGCDAGEGEDIWITNRTLTQVDQWFSEVPVWILPSTIMLGNGVSRSPTVVADNQNRIHVLWSQSLESQTLDRGIQIYYARLEEGRWSVPEPVLVSPVGVAEQPSAAITPDGELYLVWSGGQSGEIYFSKVDANRASVGSAWLKPIALPALDAAGSSPDILIDRNGVIFVVYAIPLNENRGIYLTRSQDRGETWSDVVKVFDAAAAGWEMVDNPSLTSTENDHLHLLWTRYSLPTGVGPLGLFYSRSDDGGNQWSQPDIVVDKPVFWSQVVGVGQGTVHRLWQEISSSQMTMWHEQSTDSGVTWTRVAPVSIFGESFGQLALVPDPSGRLYLLQTIRRAPNSYALQHWVYDGERWVTNQGLDLKQISIDADSQLSAVIASDGRLSAVFSGSIRNPSSGQVQHGLFFTSRLLEDVTMPVVPENQDTPAPNPTPTATVQSQPSPVPTQTLPSFEQLGELSQPPENGGNAWFGSIVGTLMAGFIVVGLFVITLGIKRSRH